MGNGSPLHSLGGGSHFPVSTTLELNPTRNEILKVLQRSKQSVQAAMCWMSPNSQIKEAHFQESWEQSCMVLANGVFGC
jgi:hypothetical protein